MGGEYPADVVRKSESLLRGLEMRHGLEFAGRDAGAEVGTGPGAGAGAAAGAEERATRVTPPSAVVGWLVGPLKC